VMVAGVCSRLLSSSVTPAHMQRSSPGGSTRRRASSVTSSCYLVQEPTNFGLSLLEDVCERSMTLKLGGDFHG